MDNLAHAGSTLSDAMLWWLGTGVLVAAELATGTFYLLMLAVGLAAAAIAAHLGAGPVAETVIAALVGLGCAGVLFIVRRRRPRGDASVAANPDVNIDVGNTVDVAEWTPDGRTRLDYRGAQWQARYEGSEGSPAPGPGRYVIRALDGNVLILRKA